MSGKIDDGSAPTAIHLTREAEACERRLPEPRLLTRPQAAHYCALSLRGFDAWIKCGRLPGPILGTARWDRCAIDAALDRAMKNVANENVNTYEIWKAHYDENQLKRNPHRKKKTR